MGHNANDTQRRLSRNRDGFFLAGFRGHINAVTAHAAVIQRDVNFERFTTLFGKLRQIEGLLVGTNQLFDIEIECRGHFT
ncbi:Uncharacterised protein [Vibrio cholerae]|nr:Uncharacterised protein [Vibrio cholerae]CSB56938.1 Uncharacterised protein [Vibrio cholerae]CSB87466.1 Uncharacterised protein [Vibrio cholerae]